MTRTAFLLAAVVLPLSSADAAEVPSVVVQTVDGDAVEGRLQAVDETSLHLAGGRTLAWRNVLRLAVPLPRQRSRPAAGGLVLLANGDRLHATPRAADDTHLTAERAAGDERAIVRFPLETVRACVWKLPDGRDRRDALIRRLSGESYEGDVVVLDNGDELSGALQKIDPRQVSLRVGGTETGVDVDGVRALRFDPTLVSFPPAPERRFLVSLTDGSQITAGSVALQGERLVLEALFGERLDVPLAAVREARFLGGRAVYLSDLEPAAFDHTPFVSGDWPLQRDRSATGRPLRLRGRECPKGLGLHARSRVTYELDADYETFRATIGIDDDTGGGGSAVFGVELDGKRVYVSDELTGRSPPVKLPPIDVSEASRLTLVVEFGEYGDVLDHADWCDAVLIEEAKP